MSDIKTWSAAAASNNVASPNGFPEGMPPSGVNDSAREVMAAVRRWYESAQWIDLGDVPIYASATAFTFASDKTATYTVGRRLKLTDASTLYGTIAACAYSAPNTTVTITLDSGSLSGALSAVAVGTLTPSNSSIPTVPVANGGTGASTAAGARAGLSAQQDVITTRGDLVRGSATNVAERVTLGVKGQSIVSDGSDAKWGMLMRSHLAGLQLANNASAPTTKIDVSVGACADDTNAVTISQAASATIDCTTTGALGLDGGSLANSTWYHIFKIMKADGTDSLVASTSASFPTMPSGYTYKRRIGSFLTDGAAHIVKFWQYGDVFQFDVPVSDVDTINPGTSAVSMTLTVPPIAGILADIAVCASGATTFAYGLVTSLDQADTAPSKTVNNFTTFAASNDTQESSVRMYVKINASRQARYRASATGPNNAVRITTLGWIDRRGKDD